MTAIADLRKGKTDMLYKREHQTLIFMPSLTVPNLLPNMDECKNFEIRANSCCGRDEHQKHHQKSSDLTR